MLHRYFTLGEDIPSVSNEVRYSTAGIHARRSNFIGKCAATVMNPSNERAGGKPIEGKVATLQEFGELKTTRYVTENRYSERND